MKRHGPPGFAPEIAPYDLESSKNNVFGGGLDKYHGKKVSAENMKQIGSVVGGIWLLGVLILGYDWLWPLYLVMEVLDLFMQIPIIGSILNLILTPISWILGFAYRGAPVVEQLGALQEPRLPGGQVATYANSYIQQYGDAAMIIAAHDGYYQIVNTLLANDYREFIDAADENGNTALLYAAAKGFQSTTVALLKAGADPDGANQGGGGRTPLMEAAGGGHQQIVAGLMSAKASLDLVDAHGNTALHYGAYNGHLAVVRELLKGNPRREVKNSHGETALSYASKNGYKGIADLLRRPPTQREKAAQNAGDDNDDLADLMAGRNPRKDGKKGAMEKKSEDDQMSSLMKMLGKNPEEDETKKKGEDDLLSNILKMGEGKKKDKKEQEEDHISKLMNLFGGKDDKEKQAQDDAVSKLTKLFGGKDDKEKQTQDDAVSKLTKLFGGKEKESDEGHVAALKKQHEEAESRIAALNKNHEEAELKAQKRIVELMEKNAEHQKAAEQFELEARRHKLNVTEMAFQLQILESKHQSAELKASTEKAHADQLLEEKQTIAFEVEKHKTRAEAAERERDMYMDASQRHQERLSQAHVEMQDHLTRLEKQTGETKTLRNELQNRDERIAALEQELQRMKSPFSMSIPGAGEDSLQTSKHSEANLETGPDTAGHDSIDSNLGIDQTNDGDSFKSRSASDSDTASDPSAGLSNDPRQET